LNCGFFARSHSALRVRAEPERAAVLTDDRRRGDLRRRGAERDARHLHCARGLDGREREVEVAGRDDDLGALGDELLGVGRGRRLVGLRVDPLHLQLLAEDAAGGVDLVDAKLEELARLQVVRAKDAGLRGGDADQDGVGLSARKSANRCRECHSRDGHNRHRYARPTACRAQNPHVA